MSVRAAAFASAAALLVVAVVLFARARAAPPSRCAKGMVALGARCCGEGQKLEGERCVGTPRRCAEGMDLTPEGCVAMPRIVAIEGGVLRVGPGDWEAQGVVVPYEARLAPFFLDAIEVTEARYRACVDAGACARLDESGESGEPGRALSGVALAEAERFCRWAGGALPTADQLAFAAAGPLGRRYPWGDTGAVCRRAAWGLTHGPCAFGARLPELAGSHPEGASPEGALDLSGNVAEWTRPSTPERAVAEVRGGHYADNEAAALRSWHRRFVPVGARSAEVGFRCVYVSKDPRPLR